MIVVDADVLAYAYVRWDEGRTALADAVDLRDSDWRMPNVAISEFRNVLASYMRFRGMPIEEAARILTMANKQLAKPPIPTASLDVLRLVAVSGHTAYDCEYVAAAQAIGAKLVTGDRKLAESFPDTAITMEAFAAG